MAQSYGMQLSCPRRCCAVNRRDLVGNYTHTVQRAGFEPADTKDMSRIIQGAILGSKSKDSTILSTAA